MINLKNRLKKKLKCSPMKITNNDDKSLTDNYSKIYLNSVYLNFLCNDNSAIRIDNIKLSKQFKQKNYNSIVVEKYKKIIDNLENDIKNITKNN
jgi:hypothetical protein